MNHTEFYKIFTDQMERCETILGVKSDEYSTMHDKLHNFKVAASLQGGTMDQACGGFLAKHLVSIFDLIRKDIPTPMETWDEKITDAINYLILLKAIVVEQSQALSISNTETFGEILKKCVHCDNPIRLHEQANVWVHAKNDSSPCSSGSGFYAEPSIQL